VVGGAIVVLFMAGCGGGEVKKASPARWASVFCSAATTWGRTVPGDTFFFPARVRRLKGSGLRPAEARAQIVREIQGFLDKTKRFQGEVMAAGQLNARTGGEIEKGLNARFAQMIDYLTPLKRKAEVLPTANTNAFWRQAEALGVSIKSSAEGVWMTVANVRRGQAEIGGVSSPELEQAWNKDANCQRLERLTPS